jgi:hypothetical protein
MRKGWIALLVVLVVVEALVIGYLAYVNGQLSEELNKIRGEYQVAMVRASTI